MKAAVLNTIMQISLNVKYTKYVTGRYNYLLSLKSTTLQEILVV
jgi:hypothetical protein